MLWDNGNRMALMLALVLQSQRILRGVAYVKREVLQRRTVLEGGLNPGVVVQNTIVLVHDSWTAPLMGIWIFNFGGVEKV